MTKKKSKAIVSVADGVGGMMEMKDRRFEEGEWPIKFEIPTEDEQADRWPRYLAWELHRREWSSGGLSQLDRAENSGTITVAESGNPQLEIVWERKRGRPLKAKARLASSSTLSLEEAERLICAVNDSCRMGITKPIYRRGTLHYDGLAWRGELWLDGRTRLGPPTLQDETAMMGPRIVHVDATVDCVGESDMDSPRKLLLEISVFLTVVMETAVRLPDHGRTWVWTDTGTCEVRNLGYLEPVNPISMPDRGAVKKVPCYPPDNPPLGIIDQRELSVREDISDLWILYKDMNKEKRSQFLQAAAKWQEALIHWQDRPSLSFALMVVACEALKPINANYNHNCYDVIQVLLGETIVDRIKRSPYPAQDVRNAQLHIGKFHSSELMMMNFLMSYDDPSFRNAHREMSKISAAAISEWLKRRGSFEIPIAKQRPKSRQESK